jgi:bacillopeptidase F (M6 metalloprotease family)
LGVIAGPDSGDGANPGFLDPGEQWVYTADGFADSLTATTPNTVAGCGDDRPTYENVGTVNTGSVSDSDPSHYCNPVTGDWQMATGHDDVAYKRLAATVDLTGAATASVDFSTSYGIDSDWDYMFVEVHTVGADDWTTLPDANGHTSQATGLSCLSGWADQLHPQLFHYQDIACNPTGTTGVWHATTGVSDGIEQWSIDLSAYAGSQVEVLISFATDWGTGDLGVFVDDVITTVDGAVVSVTSFEDGLGDWTIPGAPDGSVANPNDWQRVAGRSTALGSSTS